MNQAQFVKSGRFGLGPVDVVSKAKSCGKAGCGRCPHGGFWYAYVPHLSARNHHRVEIYLGRVWDSKKLLAKLEPALRVFEFREVVTLIAREDAREALAGALVVEREIQSQIVHVLKAARREALELRARRAANREQMRRLRRVVAGQGAYVRKRGKKRSPGR